MNYFLYFYFGEKTMFDEEDVQHILNRLADENLLQISFSGLDIMVHFVDDASKVSFTASIYEGENYIPHSVRGCLSGKSPFSYFSLPTFITVNESLFQVRLHYLEDAQFLNQNHFKEILEDFSLIVKKWRLYLDERGKYDLIHIRIN